MIPDFINKTMEYGHLGFNGIHQFAYERFPNEYLKKNQNYFKYFLSFLNSFKQFFEFFEQF